MKAILALKDNVVLWKVETSSRYFKITLFGIFERNGRAYSEIAHDYKNITLQQVIFGKVALESEIYSDGWSGYND